MSRNICVTTAEGNTGFLITKLLLTEPSFKKNVNQVTALAINAQAPYVQELKKLGAVIAQHKPGRVRDTAKVLQDTKADTLMLIPPAHVNKIDITLEILEAAKRVNIGNVCLLSAAGCDMADRDAQPRLREFIDLEVALMKLKGDPSTRTGYSPCIIRPGFYAENLLLYTPQAQQEGLLPIPIGKDHKFPPIALKDVADLAAHVLTGKGKHGFSDQHRGQLMTMTGPMLVSGDELAQIASNTLGVRLVFDDVSGNEARRLLRFQTSQDEAERQYLLEYYSLVREGKTNYISTNCFHDVTGSHPIEPPQFFETYKDQFMPKMAVQRIADGV
ncbi:conserved hypothetical protein [Talaromyces stipitatus ATCC 10500]|uniref:NmrA-like domain-containing protein n=1 Tax=Talaromyces stipitatus (strain ATCC 10500 / CBS 375.48 / QM 6759 / NRRL 1006) TaxID=441959 RepID=B8M185_TALSN|nr:uncharacterized protein TSTA_082600 [Talaromyces stipitatus ATCC 10500]EED21027.1 conserved hypothetical protein [Talaromyces stipitatus ATCC 10500]